MVKQAQRGDDSAKAWLYKQFGKAMFNICTRLTGNTNDAEDVLQNAFIRAFDRLHQLKQPELFGGWLRRIVVTECLQQVKRAVNWHDLEEETWEIVAEEPTAWWNNIPMELVHSEIKKLPNGCREVFVLYMLEDYTHKKIAQELGISESTSKSQYQRARQLLKDRIIQQNIKNGSV